MNKKTTSSSDINMRTDYLALAREEIDSVDAELRALFARRMNAVRIISIAKKYAGVPTDVPTREADILAKIQKEMPENLQSDTGYLFHTLFGISKRYQEDHPFERLMTRILLCGSKYCDKVVVAKMLAELLHVPCFDTDVMLTEHLNHDVEKYYDECGENPFRTQETELLRSLDETLPDACVVILGENAVSNPFFPPYLLHHTGYIVWLNLPVETVCSRIERQGVPSFLKNTQNPKQMLYDLYTEKNRYFRAAAETVVNVSENESSFQIVCSLLNSLPDKVFHQTEGTYRS